MTEAEERSFAAAVAAFRSGDLNAALGHAAQAVAAGTAAEPRHLLGLVWCRLGDPGRGVEPLRAAAAARPGDMGYQLMLARALIDSGSPAAVLAMAEPPNEAIDLWLARAEAAERAGDSDAGLAAWRIIAAARPDDPAARLALARTLAAANRLAEAEQAYQAVLAIAPATADAVVEVAMLLERASRIDELAALIARAEAAGISARDRAFPNALLAFRKGVMTEAKLHLDQVASGGMHALRLRARIEDRLGRSEAAFAAAEAMNRIAPDRDRWRARAAAYRAHLRDQAAAMSADWAARLRPLEPLPGRSPVFLLGFPRSGTTLLDTFLMGHPAIAVIEERPMLIEAADPLGPAARLDEVAQASLERARQAYCDRLERASPGDGRLVIDKFPLNLTAAAAIHLLFPGAPIIAVRRHPCDCVLSGLMQAFAANVGMASFLDLADAADFYDAAQSLWTRSRDLLPLNVHEIAYEALVADPEAELRPLIAFLGLDWDPALLDHRATARARGAIPNTSYDQVVEPIGGNAVYRWRRYEKPLAPVLPVLRPWAERLGYILPAGPDSGT